jgi:glycosyltransferase involved in cell wall biosynthesis
LKILICCEFFYPSIGGVQEVIKQIARRLAANGHEVTIATTKIPARTLDNFEKIKIESFSISGNLANGISGEIDRYRSYVKQGNFDVLFIYAAQQWAFDSLIDILDEVKAKKVFVPCGFSGLYDHNYIDYFARLPAVLNKFDSLIFHSKNYRDYVFAKEHSLGNLFFIPNGADNVEFEIPTKGFRLNNNIADDETLLMTVGSINGAKGHLEVAEALSLLNYDEPITLILNGSQMPRHNSSLMFKLNGFDMASLKRLIKSGLFAYISRWRGRKSYFEKLDLFIKEVNRGKYGKNKRILLTDLPRDQLISCYFESDLFVFASNIEYSPLVLFEAAAAGLPFLSVSVGNVPEIAEWTKGGVVCPSKTNNNGYTSVNVAVLSKQIELLLNNKDEMYRLGKNGRTAWKEKFNWDIISSQYEAIFFSLLNDKTH